MLTLNYDSSTPLYIQIYEHIKEKIISGEISEGSKLPSTRTLSSTLNASRNTVESAYLQLSSEGYVTSKAGSGFIVEKLDSMMFSELKNEGLEKIEKQKEQSPKINTNTSYKYNFNNGSCSAADFPLLLWKKISNKCLSSLSAEDMMSYSTGKGELELRIEIMKYLSKSRGVTCNPEQIIISSGLGYSLNLLCQLFRKDFDKIALEEPGFFPTREIFINNGYNVIPISLEKDGLSIEELENSSAKIVYVTPSHQFPAGSVMPIQKRLMLLDWAKRKNGVIIEDDYDSELRYNSKPIPSIQSIDSKGSVVYIGTFSKALSPNLRLNYMVLPQSWMERYDKLFNYYPSSVPIIQQKIMHQFMESGHWDRHLRKITLLSKRRHDVLIQTIQELMGDKVIIHGKNAGLHILLEINNGLNEEELIERAKAHGVCVSPVSIFWMHPDKYTNNMVLLAFRGMSENEIKEGINLLNQAWFG